MSPSRTDPAADFAALREDLGDLATLTLSQVERAIAGWEDSDPSVAESVAEGDREIDLRSAALEARILQLHQNWSTFASDLRLLHVGLIAAVALERVGNLAVSIARLAGSPPSCLPHAPRQPAPPTTPSTSPGRRRRPRAGRSGCAR